MTLPTAMTDTYVTNLLRDGQNEHFELLDIGRRVSEDDGIIVGVFYRANLGLRRHPELGDKHVVQGASGTTPKAAVRRALEKHGVTFR